MQGSRATVVKAEWAVPLPVPRGGVAPRDTGTANGAGVDTRVARTLQDTIRAIALIVEMRDPYTAGHQRRVAELSFTIARQLGMPTDDQEGVRFAALVHDLGKLHVPAEILAKPGRLTPEERRIVALHRQAGFEILKVLGFPWPIAQVACQHHERRDGSGYPYGRQGDEIHPAAYIVAVADVVGAMASHRPYRAALGMDTARAEIVAGKGLRYQHAVVESCLAVLEKGVGWWSTDPAGARPERADVWA